MDDPSQLLKAPCTSTRMLSPAPTPGGSEQERRVFGDCTEQADGPKVLPWSFATKSRVVTCVVAPSPLPSTITLCDDPVVLIAPSGGVWPSMTGAAACRAQERQATVNRTKTRRLLSHGAARVLTRDALRSMKKYKHGYKKRRKHGVQVAGCRGVAAGVGAIA
jgi:hypothetical protein